MRTLSEKELLWVAALGGAFILYAYSRSSSGIALFSGAVGAVENLFTARGLRNNNPGNIERSSIQWQGSIPADQVQAVLGIPYDPTFEQMVTPSAGIRMIGHTLRSKAQRGLTSVDALIRSYSATDQDVYVANVAQFLGVDPFQSIDVEAALPQLATAIIAQENGSQPYSDALIAQAVVA